MLCRFNCFSCPFAYLCIPMFFTVLIALRRHKKLQRKRMFSQLSFLFITNSAFIFGATGLIYSYFYCWESPFALMACPIGILEHAFVDKAWPLLVYLAGTIAVVSTIFGRAACGWACPIGLLQDLVRGRRVRRIEADRKMRYMKYFILFAILPACYFTGTLAYTNICPIGGLTATLPNLALAPYGYTFTSFFIPKMAITFAFLVLIVLISRGWCRHFCPVGAMMGQFNKVSFLELRFYEERCIKCNKCSRVCPMQIDMPYDNKSGECIRCGKCVDACPKNALVLEFRWQ